MMPADSILTGRIPPANAEARADEPVLACVAWMGELEASLEGSRKALLALDLAGIERWTSEQLGLIRKLEAMRWPQREDEPGGFGVLAPELEQELRRSGNRILGAARLQASLLARAQSKLRILANM